MDFLLNLLFPKFCIGCNKIGYYICPHCFEKFEFIKTQKCPYCLIESNHGKTHDRCRKEGGIDGEYSILAYSGITKIFIKDIKYRRIYSVLSDFFKLIPNNVMQNIVKAVEIYKIDYIQPIPLHPLREKARGFNQAEHIARRLADIINIPIISTLSRRINTFPQAKIAKKEDRRKNIQGAFQYSGDAIYQNKNILLIDDLFTSGNTSKEAALVLKRKGVEKVFVLTLAHG